MMTTSSRSQSTQGVIGDTADGNFCLQAMPEIFDDLAPFPLIEADSSSRKPLQSIAELSEASPLAMDYLQAALADNTRRAYQGDLADFFAWGGEIPCSPETLANYVAGRAGVHSPHTIARRIVGICRAHTSQGLPDPSKNDLVRSILRGVRRKKKNHNVK